MYGRLEAGGLLKTSRIDLRMINVVNIKYSKVDIIINK